MAFDYTNLYPDTASNGSLTKTWNYTTLDASATVSASGYFNKVYNRLGIGDIIFSSSVDSFDTRVRTTVTSAILLVSGITGQVVTTTVVSSGSGGGGGAGTGDMLSANNLSDVSNVATARTNLGITATGADTTYLFRANNLSDLANVATARTNLGLGTGSIEVVIDGSGSVLTTGLKGYLPQAPFACTITQATLVGDQSGSIVVNIWKCTYAQFDAGATHPVVGDKITASAPPAITSATKSQDSTLTGWTTSIAAGDVLAFNIDSVSTITRVALSLKYTRA